MNEQIDHGKTPYVVDIEDLTLSNANYRTTMWTGEHLQLTVMSIAVGGDIGLEVHGGGDQFLRVERGRARVEMGPTRDEVTFREDVSDDWVILIPAGTWHNVINTGDTELKLYALYGPPDHDPGTVHATQADAMADPHEH